MPNLLTRKPTNQINFSRPLNEAQHSPPRKKRGLPTQGNNNQAWVNSQAEQCWCLLAISIPYQVISSRDYLWGGEWLQENGLKVANQRSNKAALQLSSLSWSLFLGVLVGWSLSLTRVHLLVSNRIVSSPCKKGLMAACLKKRRPQFNT